MIDIKDTALFYEGISGIIAILIPKKNGKGYLKSPFGGHHCNSKYFEFLELQLPVGDCFDIDGYLAVNFSNSWEEGYNEKLHLLRNGIQQIFPQVKNTKIIGESEFYNIILNPR